MIVIREDNHVRLGGITSLFISFTFNQEVVNIIKMCDTYYYNKTTHEWETLLTNLSFLLDNLTCIDDIKLVLMNDSKSIDDVKLDVIPLKKPYEHQVEAVKYGLLNKRWLLLDSPGLGKTYSIIMLVEELKYKKNLKHCLVICGINTLKLNWENEIKKCSHLDSIVIGKKINSKGNICYSSVKERAEQLMSDIKEFFIIINIESLRDKQIVDAINNSPNNIGMMVLDEAHKCKGPSSLQSKNLLSISSEYMIAATGTLVVSNCLDVYVPLAWIGKERKKNLTNFKNTYCVFDSYIRGRIVGFKNVDLLKQEISSCSLRRTKEDVLKSLPSKTIIREYIEMSDSHRKLYDEISGKVVEDSNKEEKTVSNLLSLVVKLREATSCPHLLDDSVESSKVERCVELVKELISIGEKVVVFSNFKAPIYHLKDLLNEYTPLVCTGDTKDNDVQNNIEMFQNDDTHMLFLATSQKMGTGVTLNRASYLICLDCDWTYALQQQYEDRVHRIGSKKPVFIYRLICLNTIDERVEAVLKDKEALSGYLIDNKSDDTTLELLQKFIKSY